MDLPPLVLDASVRPNAQCEGLPDSQALLDKQVTTVATRTFPELWAVHQLHLFLDQGALTPSHLMSGLLQYALRGITPAGGVGS